MADDELIELQKESKIIVNVVNVLPDIIVVSFSFKESLFEGVLLDTKKKLLPCGIVAPSHLGPPLGTATIPLEDKLFSASQRYSYFQEKRASVEVDKLPLKRDIRPPARYKNTRMTVRLRPRQVLCSKCRDICNENSENVHSTSKKRKVSQTESSSTALDETSKRKLRSSAKASSPPTPAKKLSQSHVPEGKRKKLSVSKSAHHLPSHVSENGVHERVQKIRIVGNYWLNQVEEVSIDAPAHDEDGKVAIVPDEEDPLSLPIEESSKLKGNVKEKQPDEDDDDPLDLDISENSQPRVLRKKRSIGSMEDLWDENVFEDALKSSEKKLAKTKTPIIKISFGSTTGEGTVVEIPPKSQGIPSESETEEKLREKTKRDASAKAAKKALKKAKKEARRKMVETASPARSLGGTSPRYSNLSPRYFTGYMSPRPNMDSNSPANEILYKKHKHKVKHKKRHREDKRHRDEENEENDECIRECLKQKLSINLKRLNANAYMSRASSSSSVSDTSDEQSDAVPGLPDNPLLSRFYNQDITSCRTSDGRDMAVGDVVWGKIHGFPWWPGKVVSLTMSHNEDGVPSPPHAHVAWYGSSTSSLMLCDDLNPFLETFQIRYNKRKRGPYREAIKQATTEAKRVDLMDIPPGVFSSPTQVDVMS